MKKIAVTAAAVLAFVIVFSGCQFNLFSTMDTVKVPSLTDMLAAASSDAKGFVDDVEDYLDSGAVTEDNADDVVTALEDVYGDQPDTEAGQRAAVLAGEIIITSDPDTKQVVDNVSGIFVEMSDPDYVPPADESDTETLLKNIFPADDSDFDSIYSNLETAAAAYGSFADSIDWDNDGVVDHPAEWLVDDSSEKVNIITYAIVAIAVTSVGKTTLHDFLYAGGDLGTTDPVNNSDDLLALLDFAGISFN